MVSIDAMRRIDRYVGIPLCLFFTLYNKIIFWKKDGMAHKKILFIQISEMGSSIHAYPAIRFLQNRHPKSEIFYLIFKDMAGGVTLLDAVPQNNVLTLRKNLTGLLIDTAKVINFLRKQKIDVIIDLELFSRFSTTISFLSGAKTRVGFDKFAMEGLYRGNLNTIKALYNHTIPISLNYMALAKSIESIQIPGNKHVIDQSEINLPQKRSTEEQKSRMWKKLRSLDRTLKKESKLVILNPNASQLLPLRRWPIENYIKLAKRLVELPGVYVVITGVESEKDDAEMITMQVKKKCVNLAGQTHLRELIDLYNISTLMISNDSGPPNFASLTNMPTIVLFGPETPLCYAPLGKNIEIMYANFACSPCVSAYNHRKSLCKDNKCMQAITVEQVYNQAKRHL
ncbi:MAG: glycosyltransferase family 9 protein [Candidatus Woesearchaeota archaeon]